MMSVFESVESIEKVIIFGYRVMGNAKRGSDIDLALIEKELQSDDVRHIAQVMNDQGPLPNFVDVLLYHEINNDTLKKHIDDEGCMFFERSHDQKV